MKMFKILMVSLTLVFIYSCGDDCEADVLSSVVVGQWEFSAVNMTDDQIEFLSNGTLVDPNNALIEAELNGVTLDQKSYTVTANEAIVLRAESGAQFIESSFPVTSFDCDEIVVDILGLATGVFTRR